MKKTRISIPLYFQELDIVIVNDFSKLNTFYNTSFSNENYDGFVFNHGDIIVLVIKRPDWSVICHEIVHVVNEIFIKCNIQLDRNNDEPQAYLTGFIAEEINKIICKIAEMNDN